MVDRHIYKDEIDFSALALQSPAFNKHLKPNGQLDFSDPEAVKQLTKSLLQRDFGLTLELPNDRLCPPVPNRLNYILWIQDLLDTTSDGYTDKFDGTREVVGLDIGTGASCIYPLLGCSQRPKWKFAVTDVDEKNLTYARNNIIQNNLKARIRPLQTKLTDPIIPLNAFGLENIDFAMCNPPFYSSNSDLLSSAASKSRPPHSACTGAAIEMVTPGGEVSFVSRMVDESKLLGDRCQWYTSMLGKYSSIEVIVEKLRSTGVVNWAVKDLVQGNKTRRWAVGWSWVSMRPSEPVARGTSTLPRHLLPFPSEYNFASSETTFQLLGEKCNAVFKSLDLQWQYNPTISTGIGFAKGNVWSRAARRKQQKKSPKFSTDTDMSIKGGCEEDEEAALGFKIQLKLESEDSTNVMVRWLQGRDSVLFESFCGMLKRQLVN